MNPEDEPQPAVEKTLSALWGQGPAALVNGANGACAGADAGANTAPDAVASTPSFPLAPAPTLSFSSQPSAQSQPKAQPRKRRKKEDTAAQGRLTFGVNGVMVSAPPPPEAEVKEKEKGGKTEGEKTGRRRKGKNTVCQEEKSKEKRNGQTEAIVIDDDDDDDIIEVEPRKRKPPPRKTPPSAVPDIIALDDTFSILSPDSSPHPDGIIVVGSSRARVKGPSGSRATSPIPVDRPRKADKPAHSFFAKRALGGLGTAATSVSVSSAASTTTAASIDVSAAVSVSDSDKPAAIPTPAPSAAHSFFNLASREQGVLKKGWGSVREGDEPRAPWPGGECPVHVGYDAVDGCEGRVATRVRQRAAYDASEVGTMNETIASMPPASTSTLATTPARRPPLPTSVPPFILQHPAIQAVLTTPLSSENREGWTEAHRPRTTASVLGNELEATYVRDWLLALSVGSTEARRVIRRIPRRKAADSDTDWIVDDMYGEPFTDDAYEDLPEPEDEPEFPLGGRPDKYPVIDYWIGNALLLTGPTGCGKSAAVHAAATELGWDVFEVYPGIGKRTGANLLALVGDVGKNHMVGEKREKKVATADKVKSFFGGAKKPTGAGSAANPVALDHTPVKAKFDDKPKEAAEEGKTKQSLILIDEADILYEEESTFWPAVVKLIADSHRPVVITCNNLSRIPRHSLPIHTTLYFLPPPSYLVQPYLSAIAERHNVQANLADQYHQCTHRPVDLVDQPLPPNGHEPALDFDFRAAINQLQLDRGACGRVEAEEGHDVLARLRGDDATFHLDDMLRALEAASFADAYVAPAAWELMDIYDIDHLSPGPDDEDGLHHLLKPSTDAPVTADNSYAARMAAALSPAPGHKVSQLQLVQTQYVRHILPALDEVVTLESRLLPHPTLFTETMPFLRIMVDMDDLLLEADRAAMASGAPRVHHVTGRTVRGNAKGYERRRVMEDGALEIVRGGGLRCE